MISFEIFLTIHKISYYKVRVSTGSLSVETRWLGGRFSSACIAFQDWRASAKLVLILVEEIISLSQLLYLGILPFCTRSRGLVINLKVPGHLTE